MKALIVFLLIFLFNAAFGQKTRPGVKGGYNNSTIIIKDFSDYERISGIYLGFLANIEISEKLTIQPELFASYQGGRISTYKASLFYNELPILVQFINKHVIIETGPQFDFLISARHKYVRFETQEPNWYKKMSFSWALGLGYKVSNDWGVETRFNLGISNIRKPGYIEGRNSVIQIGLFYQFLKRAKKK